MGKETIDALEGRGREARKYRVKVEHDIDSDGRRTNKDGGECLTYDFTLFVVSDVEITPDRRLSCGCRIGRRVCEQITLARQRFKEDVDEGARLFAKFKSLVCDGEHGVACFNAENGSAVIYVSKLTAELGLEITIKDGHIKLSGNKSAVSTDVFKELPMPVSTFPLGSYSKPRARLVEVRDPTAHATVTSRRGTRYELVHPLSECKAGAGSGDPDALERVTESDSTRAPGSHSAGTKVARTVRFTGATDRSVDGSRRRGRRRRTVDD